MRNVIMSFAVMLGSIVSSCAFAKSTGLIFPKQSPFTKENTVIINQPIARGTMGPVYARMQEFITKSAPSSLNLIIDSPGGSVTAGFIFVSQMKALQGKGTKITCYVPGLAASMAFQILTQCDERIVLEESALLWHRARTQYMGIITAPQAGQLARDLQAVDDYILATVMKVLVKDMSEEDIKYHFEVETLHIGSNLCNAVPHFCTSKSSVAGLLEALTNSDFTSTTSMSPFGDKARKTKSEDEIIYILPKIVFPEL